MQNVSCIDFILLKGFYACFEINNFIHTINLQIIFNGWENLKKRKQRKQILLKKR